MHNRPAGASWWQLVAPRHKDAAGAPVAQCGEREVAEFLLDQPDLGDVISSGPIGETEEFL
jgi:hypothetical protein